MPTQVNPKHNLNSLLIGTGEFSFSDGAISPADSLLKGFQDVGNIVGFTPAKAGKSVDHMGSYRGIRLIDRTIDTEAAFTYTLKSDEWNYTTLSLLYGGTVGTPFTQTVQTSQAADALGFNAISPTILSQPTIWYDLKVAGKRITNLTAVTGSSGTEGTDWVIDYALGRIQFITQQNAPFTATITAPAITANSAIGYFLSINPLQKLRKSGMGRLTLYDQGTAGTTVVNTTNANVVLDHQDFSCTLDIETSAEVNGTAFTDLTLKITVTSAYPGTVYLRSQDQ